MGADVVAKNITIFHDNFLNHVNRTMETVSIMLDKKVTENMSLVDHDLADLRRLGHPYRIGGEGLHEPGYQVHNQSGRLLASKRSGIIKASISGASSIRGYATKGDLSATAWCGVYERSAFYAPYIIYGTSKMIPRDFLTGSLNEIKDEATAYLKENLRDFVFNFHGTAR